MLEMTYVKDYSEFVLAKFGNDLIFMNWKRLSYDHKYDRKLQSRYESADIECVCVEGTEIAGRLPLSTHGIPLKVNQLSLQPLK